MNCSQCGKPIAEGMRFCKHCGHLQNENAYRSPAGGTSGQKQPDNTLKTMMVIVAVLTVVLIAALVVFISGNDNESEQIAENTPRPTISIQVLPPQPSAEEETEAMRILPEGNPYESCRQTYNDYILPESNSRYLSQADLQSLPDQAITLARQEIYARHGQVSPQPQVQEYFESLDWYRSGGNLELNAYEEANLYLMDACMAVRNGSWARSSNPYAHAFSSNDHYACADSNSRFLTAEDLADLNDTQLQLMRNEIFARRGYIFGATDLREYFYSQPWYKPSTPGSEFNASVFNQFELQNVNLIQVYEKRAAGISFSHDNPYRQYYSYSRDYIFPYSDSRYLTDYDCSHMSADQLCLARNEILARRGFTFSDRDLLEYFLQFDWYLPETPAGDKSGIDFNNYELSNMDFLETAEKRQQNKIDLNSLDTTLNYTVSNDYYSITLPAYFREYCDVDLYSSTAISCDENQSRTIYELCGGHVFTFNLAATLADYEYLPSYTTLGRLVNSNGESYYVYVRFPTDIQFADEYRALYSKMSGEYSRICKSLTGLNGFTFIPD